MKIVGPIPAIAISFVRMFPTPATIAFGGVPTLNSNKSLNDFMKNILSSTHRHVESKTTTQCSWVHQQHGMFSDSESHLSQNRQNYVGNSNIRGEFGESLANQADQEQKNKEREFLETSERFSQHFRHS